MRRVAIVGVFLFCLAAAQAQTAPSGKWVKLAPFPEPGNELAGASTGGKFYVLGGIAPGSKPAGIVYEYDPTTDHWTKKKPMPVASHHAAVFGYNGKIYAFGGFVLPTSGEPAFVPIDTAWQYDPTTDSWKELAPMPTKRGGAVAAMVGDKIYVIGGTSTHPGSSETGLTLTRPQRPLGTVEEYDPSANTWRARSSMPTARVVPAVGAVDGKIYVIGGRLGSVFMRVASNTDIVEQYDPATDSWGPMRARMPTPRSACAWGTYNGRIYVAGGEVENSQVSAVYRTLEAYDPAANEWTTLPPLTVPRFGSASAVIGNRLYVASGGVQGGIDIPNLSPSFDAFEIPGK